MGDAALGDDRCGLDHHEPGAALGEFPEMHEMPVIGDAVGRRILAHRRNEDAVSGGHAAKRDRLKQERLRHQNLRGNVVAGEMLAEN